MTISGSSSEYTYLNMAILNRLMGSKANNYNAVSSS